MKNTFIKYRNSFIHWNYSHILKPYFFRQDPEDVHDRMIGAGKRLGAHGFTRALTRSLFDFQDPMLRQTVLGLDFANPIGLAAGFDKNADLINILPAVGFGSEEIGSITGYSTPLFKSMGL